MPWNIVSDKSIETIPFNVDIIKTAEMTDMITQTITITMTIIVYHMQLQIIIIMNNLSHPQYLNQRPLLKG